MEQNILEDKHSFYEKRMQLITINSKMEADFLKDAIECFSGEHNEKSLPFWWLYDKQGSEIFENITIIPEYYLTRSEDYILKQYSEKLVSDLKPETTIIELGSGSSKKTRTLLEAFIKVHKRCTYIPIDISKEMLIESAHKLLNLYKELEVIAINATYDNALKYIAEHYVSKPKLMTFLGSSIGNLNYHDEINFLCEINETFQKNDRLLIGMDLIKEDIDIIKRAYSDPGLLTEKFILNVLHRMNKELNSNFNVSNFKLEIEFNSGALTEGNIARVELYIKSLTFQKVILKETEFNLRENERIHIENSHKYSKVNIEKIAYRSGFCVEKQWMDDQRNFSLNLFAPQKYTSDTIQIQSFLKKGWHYSDLIFEQVLTKDAFLQRPIELRHPFIFYYGHLTSFEKNQIFKHILKTKSITENFDDLFARGIDPLVDDPTKCHSHSAEINHSVWPAIEEIKQYQDDTRKYILENLDNVLKFMDDPMAQKGRVFRLVNEHTLMHVETLLYMIQVLDEKYKKKLDEKTLNLNFQKSSILNKKSMKIPAGIASMGVDFHQSDWGWDNEFPLYNEYVEEFEIDELPVTNKEFILFIESGEYENSENWSPKDYEWKKKCDKKHPTSLHQKNGKWMVTSVFNFSIPIEQAQDWPIYCSQAEAVAYAKHIGKRLPTESEYIRAAYGFPEENSVAKERKHPWGNDAPQPGIHGNFDFFSWAPYPVGSFPQGKSAWGVYELVGNGWEWTLSTFKGFPGFEKTLTNYQGYSADFFDDQHYVMLGGSWATSTTFIRRTFRNWFQNHYEYMFSKFRCVKTHKK